ncbi:MAG: hypothetical protein KKE24_02970 [Candidatus Thermoplasmatota archaeon]|nr:hypothetical protein [Candidatus Thermoplasmatota archaeon]
MDIRAVARCYPTEDRSKVVQAILSIFPDAVIDGDDEIIARTSSFEHFSEMLQKQRIRSAARSALRRSMMPGSIRFNLNKQVATIGKISFSEECRPLGDIVVEVSCEDPEGLIDSIAPLPVKEGPK